MQLAVKIALIFHLLFTGNLGGEFSTLPVTVYSDQPVRDMVISVNDDQYIYKDESTKNLEKLIIPWLLYYTNQYRKEAGLDSLKYDDCLLLAAGYHTDYLFNESKETHQFKLVHIEEPDSKWFKGKGPSERALTAGCKKYCGENALYFTRSGLQSNELADKVKLNGLAKKLARDMVYDQWHKSPAHRQNMLTKGYSSLGVSAAIGKRSADNAPEQLVIFGVQVMAY
ncbi:MAG: CAP domain-containing protein [Ferruginibacter sp.]